MDEQKLPQEQPREKWLEDAFSTTETGDEIGVDEQAIFATGLTHPSDLEFEKIMQEFLRDAQAEAAANPAPVPAEPEMPVPAAEPETFKDDEFRATFGEGDDLIFHISLCPLP